MCGIAGIFDHQATREVDLPLLKRMTRSLIHRGPDGEGYYTEPGVGFGHRRLSVIDLKGGRQPIFNEDRSVAVTYNGEIYNFRELQRELESKGHRFRTRCDTEVIVHAWEEWGDRCVDRFNGMFAFAIWDRKKHCIFLARDRIGIKPLYYALTADGYCLFGSELKAILEHPGVRREIRSDAVEDYFTFGYVPDPKTILQDAWKLPPGHTLTVYRQRPINAPQRYWDVPFRSDNASSPETLHAELIERLSSSVQLRMIADVPLGAFLSGGVDSSAVVALMAQLSSEPVNTTSISFGDPEFNEAHYAREVADMFRTNHNVKQVDSSDFSLIDLLPKLYDEPFADSSALPTYRVCELAREKVTVALSGDGGDENFIGYRRHRWHGYEERIRRNIPHALRKPIFGLLGNMYPKLDWAPRILRAKSTLQALSKNSLEAYLHSVSIFPAELRRKLFNGEFHRNLQGYSANEVFREHAKRAPVPQGLSLIQYLDFKTYLPGDILTKVDRASMAHSLEVRVPILDHEFVEWVAGIPVEMKLVGKEGKLCFKKALELLLPPDILYREKMGFAVPISNWFRGPLKNEIRGKILEGGLLSTDIFDPDMLRQVLNDHLSGKHEHSVILWALLMFGNSVERVLKKPDFGASQTLSCSIR